MSVYTGPARDSLPEMLLPGRISQGLPDAAASQSDWAQLIQTVIRYSAQWFRHGVLFLYACEDQVILRYLRHETRHSQTLTIRCHSMAHLRLLFWLSWLVLLLPSSALLRRRSVVLLAAEAARRLGLGVEERRCPNARPDETEALASRSTVFSSGAHVNVVIHVHAETAV